MIENKNGAIVVTGERDVRFASMLAQRSALRLEILGMRRSGKQVSKIIREQYGLTEKNKAKLLEKFNTLIEQTAEQRKIDGQTFESRT